MTRRKPRDLRPDEKELWEKVRQSAVPLQNSAKDTVVETVLNIDRPQPLTNIQHFEIGSPTAPPISKPAPMTSVALAMDARKFDRLKKGKLSPDAKMDLHGMTLNQAHPALVGFILSAHQKAYRLVLVVTGKGKPKPDGEYFSSRNGILKQQVPRWLAQHPMAPLILQTSEAHGKHGGGGALYVYLRRRR